MQICVPEQATRGANNIMLWRDNLKHDLLFLSEHDWQGKNKCQGFSLQLPIITEDSGENATDG